MTRLLVIVAVAVGWIGVRGRLGLGDLLVALLLGVAFALVLPRPARDPGLRRAPAVAAGILRVLANLLKEIVASNVEQLGVVIRPRRELRPHWVEFETRLESPFLRAALGVMISITPMTVFCDDRQTGGKRLLVHVLDTSDVAVTIRRIRRRMEDPLLALEDTWSR